MSTRPVLKRYYKHECTNCGRKLDRTLRREGKHWRALKGALPQETVWCKRCCAQARQRTLNNPPTFAQQCDGIEGMAAYLAALLVWASE